MELAGDPQREQPTVIVGTLVAHLASPMAFDGQVTLLSASSSSPTGPMCFRPASWRDGRPRPAETRPDLPDGPFGSRGVPIQGFPALVIHDGTSRCHIADPSSATTRVLGTSVMPSRSNTADPASKVISV